MKGWKVNSKGHLTAHAFDNIDWPASPLHEVLASTSSAIGHKAKSVASVHLITYYTREANVSPVPVPSVVIHIQLTTLGTYSGAQLPLTTMSGKTMLPYCRIGSLLYILSLSCVIKSFPLFGPKTLSRPLYFSFLV